jgi:cytochrome P450
MTEPAEFSTLLPGLMADPYPAYHRLRDSGTGWNAEENAWVVHLYADVARIMADRSFEVAEVASIVGRIGQATGKETGDLTSVLEAVLFLRNPPGHTEARKFLVAVMTAYPLSTYRPMIESVVDQLLAAIAKGGAIDAITDFADLVPPLFMGRLLGLSETDVRFLVETVSEVTMAFDRGRSPRFYERVNRTVRTARSLFRDAIADRRRHPADDGLTRMIDLADRQFGLDDDVIASRALFLLIAGVETTSALIGNAIRALLDHPDSGRRIAADPTLIDGAIDEVLRFDGPVQQATRIATQACTIAGRMVQPGDRVVLLLGAAHRDPAAYDRPDLFDIARSGPPHLGFGTGLHHCLGASLARLETGIALERLFALSPVAAIDYQPRWWPHRTLRRLTSLPVTIPPQITGPSQESPLA